MKSIQRSVDVINRQVEPDFDPHSPLYVLQWRHDLDRLWELPGGVCIAGPGPQRFGYRLRKRNTDQFDFRLYWDGMQFTWPEVSRVELLASSLAQLLGAVGVDLWTQLDTGTAAPRLKPRAA